MTTTAPASSRRAAAAQSSEIRDLLRLTQRAEVISLAGGLPDPDGFPAAAIAEVAARLVATQPNRVLQYGPTEGDDQLRSWLAERHASTTGRPTTIDQVLVTTGSQQALDLTARVLCDPGDVIAVEDPGYLGALQAFRAADVALAAVPVDDRGMQVELVASRAAEIKAVYTVSTFQNPTGTTLTHDRRVALAAAAEADGFVVVEDAPYADLRFRGDPLHPIAAHTDRCVAIGTISKTLAPGLRVGWMVGPSWLIAAATRLKQAVDLHTSSLSQGIVAELVASSDWYDEQIAAVAERYGRRATVLRQALVDRFGDRIEVTDPDGGMFLWATLDRVDSAALLPLAVEAGTAFVPGRAFAVDRDLTGGLRLSFATADESGLVTAVDRLAGAVARYDRQ
jgi:2-aminoadipate transaminase